MNNNPTNATNFLRSSRDFPTDDVGKLGVELNKSYIDIALAVNSRTIGLFTVNKSAVTGNIYLVRNNQRQQSLRQVYIFGAIAAGASLAIPYKISTYTAFATIYGTCKTNVPDNRPIPYASVTAAANIELNVGSSNINILVGSSSPNIVSGMIIVEWLSQP